MWGQAPLSLLWRSRLVRGMRSNPANILFSSFSMELHINLDKNEVQMSNIVFQKMILLHNALEEGWTIKKQKDSYIFTKKHEGKKEVFQDSYLTQFMKSNMDINKLLSN
jgi:hypothetical protein